MSRKVSVYIDESGFSGGKDVNVIACLGHELDRVEFETACADYFGGEGRSWRELHAVDLPVKQRHALLCGAMEALPAAYLVVAHGPGRDEVQYDHYHGVVLEAIKQLVIRMGSAADQGRHILVDVQLETRAGLNGRVFANALLQWARESGPPGIYNFMVSGLRKGLSAAMQISDLAANLVRRELLGLEVLDVSRLARTVVGVDALATADMRAFCRSVLDKQLEGGRSPGRKPKKKVVHVDRVRERPADDVVRRLTQRSGRREVRDAFPDLLELVARASKPEEELAAIAERAREAVAQRDFDLAEDANEFVFEALERRAESEGTAWLRLRTTCAWLETQNALGRFAAEDVRVLAVLPDVATLEEDERHWADLALFFTLLGVAHQNVFDFDGGMERLRRYLEFFERLRGPGGKRAVTSRHAGALFGTYALCQFFSAGFTYRRDRGAGFLERMDEGLLWSQQAQETFPDDADRRRHDIYQAHAHMQIALLTGDDAPLATAATLLDGDRLADMRLNALLAMKDRDPDELFATVARLKLAWLRGEALVEVESARLGDLPATHPYQQILGYVALNGAGKTAQAARRRLKETPWPANVTGTIAGVFSLQIDWEREGGIDQESIDRVLGSLHGASAYHWQAAGIPGWLASMGKEYRGRGPLEVLPFNYA